MLKNLSTLLTKPGFLDKLPAESTREKLKEGENRYVSILFADIVGFTHMSEILDHEVVQELFDQLMMSFSERVIKYGGYIDKYEGDLVMAHFGSKEFLEHVSRRAVYAGLELIEVIDLFNEIRNTIPELAGVKKDLKIRVGINSGWVTTGKVGLKREGDFTVYGDVVNLASRMESNGVPNRIMLPLDIKKEINPYFEFEYFCDKSLKGISEPIPVYLVKDIKHHVVAREVSNTGFIGRDVVLEHLSDIYHKSKEQLQDKQSLHMVGIKAPAGMGKTRLTQEFCNKISSDVYISEISPLIQNPYSCFFALLKSLFGLPAVCTVTALKSEFTRAFNDLLGTLPTESAALLREQTPIYHFLLGIDDKVSELEPQETISAINYALLILISGFAEQQNVKGHPLLLIFDDLHFADELSIAALNYLIKNLFKIDLPIKQPDLQIIILLLYRDSFSLSPLILNYQSFEEIELSELDDSEIAQFIGHSIDDNELKMKLLPHISKKSAGNPMFIEEWLNMLNDHLNDGKKPDWDITRIPNSITALILTRLNNLDQQSRQLMQHASTIGMCFRKYLLCLLEADLLGCKTADIAIEPIFSSDILLKSQDNADEETLSFRHELYHQAIYNTLLKTNRKILHGIVAAIIEIEYQTDIKNWYFALADHYEKAGNISKCIDYLNKSMEYAHTLFMNKKELELCEKLLQYSPEADIEQIMLKKATLYLDMGDLLNSESILNAISLQNLKTGLPRDKYILTRFRLLHDRYDLNIAKDYIDLHLPEIMTDSAKITGLIYQLDMRRLDVNDKEFISDAKKVLQQLDESQSQYSRLENIIGLFYSNRGDYQQAIEYFDRTILHSQQHKIFLRWAHQNKASVLSKMGRTEEAMSEYNIALNLARYMDDESGICKLLSDMGTLCLNTGDDKEAIRMLNESYDISLRTGNVKQQGLAFYNIARLYCDLDDLPNSRKKLSQSLRINYKLSNYQGLSHGRDLLGDILYREGKSDYAQRIYLSNLAFQQKINDNEGVAHTYGNLGNIAADNQDYETAESYYRLQQTLLNEIGDIEGEGKAWYNWGIIDVERDRLSQAIEKFTAALALFEKGGFTIYIKAAKDYLEDLKKQSKDTKQSDGK